jgi:cytosine/adenosine deaminase-related metal-dependent hydrolase
MGSNSSDILIRGGTVVTMDPKLGTMGNTDVLIQGGLIKKIGTNLEAAGAEIMDAQNMIVMPGFVDCHRHMWQTQLRAITADWSLYDYSSRIRSIYSSYYDPEDAYLGNYAGFLEALNAGVTTIVDHSHIMNTPDHADEVVRSFMDSGIRGIFCYGLFGNVKPEDKVTYISIFNPKWHYDDARRIKKKYFNADYDRVMMGISLAESDFFEIEISRIDLNFGREIGAKRISAHVGMAALNMWTRYIERLERSHLMGEDLLFIHGSGLTKHELDICAKYKAAVINTPETELQMGMGYPVTWRVLAAGGRTGIGIDIVSNQSADMFTQIRLNMAVQRAYLNDKLYHKGMAPKVVVPTVQQLLEIATIKGAEAIGLDSKIGSITPGKEADIILLRTDTLSMFPVNNPVNSIIMSANVSDVDTVLVGGRTLKRHGQLVGVDIKSVYEKTLKSRDKIIAGGAKKGFSQGEAIMQNIFPLTGQTAFMSWMGGMMARSPSKKIQGMLFQMLIKKV